MWNNGPDRIKRDTVTRNIKHGGLGMINLKIFIDSLKINWLRKLLLRSEEENGFTLTNFNVVELIKHGSNYSKIKAVEIINTFWKDVLISWSYFCKTVEISSLTDILLLPLWYNENLSDKNLFLKR